MKIKNIKTGQEAILVETYEELYEIYMEESRRFSGGVEPAGELLEHFNRIVPMSFEQYEEDCEKKKARCILAGWNGARNSHPDLVWTANEKIDTEWEKV